MDSLSPSRTWVMRAAFVGLALVIIFFRLLPLDTLPRLWAPPDLLTAFTFAWVLRRPDYVPVLLIAVVLLLADLLLQRPPGLWGLLVVIGSEYLKNRIAGLSEASFAGEWVGVSLILVAATLLNRMVLGLLAVEQAAPFLSLVQLVMTIAAYPLVALLTHSVMGVRRLTAKDAAALGARI